MIDNTPNQVRQLADINESPSKKSNVLSNLFVLLIFIAGAAVFGYAGYDWWRNRPVSQAAKNIPSPVTNSAPSLAPTSKIPSPIPTTKPPVASTLKIQVLNGTGVAGMAAKAKDALVAAGYTDVVTGNAPAYEYETTVIMVNSQSQSSLEALKTLLSKSYKLDNQKNDLDVTSPYDVVIIVGKN